MGTAQLWAVIPRCGHGTASAPARMTPLTLCHAGNANTRMLVAGGNGLAFPAFPRVKDISSPAPFPARAAYLFPDILPVPLVCAAWVLALAQCRESSGDRCV